MDNTKEKKQVSEETLRRLAECRKKGIETRKMKAELKKKEAEEAKAKLKAQYEEKVLKKKAPAPAPTPEPVEETEKEIYPTKSQQQDESEDEEYEAPPPPKTKKKSVSKQQLQQVGEPNYKQMYYQHKLSMLQHQQEQASFASQYARLPPYAHAVDIAKNSIRQNVDKAVLEKVYKELFNC